MKFLSQIFICLVLVLPTQAQNPDFALTDPVPVDPDVRIGTLKNGFTYYLRRNEKPEDKVEFRLVVNAGSILENDDQQGLAHFVEHMAFNGTEHFEKNELINYLQSIGVEFGADLNAWTSFDETVYMLPIPTEDPEVVDRGLLVLKDWASGLSFDPEEIDKERGVVTEEWRIGRGASQRMRDQWFPVVFKDSKYAERLPIGKKEIIQNASYETIRQFYEDWYRPDLMAIVAVGDIDVDDMEKKIKSLFGKIKSPKKPRVREISEVPGHEETHVVIARDEEAPFTQVQVLYKRDKSKTGQLTDLKEGMKQSLYSRMINQRLDEIRRSENPPFIGAGSGFSSMVKTESTYYSAATVGDGGVLTGLEAVITENRRVRAHGFTPGELERAKRSMMRGYERALKEKDKTESSRYVSDYIQHFLNQDPIPQIDFSTAFAKSILPEITLEEVNVLADRWITKENRVIMVTAPDKEGVSLPGEAELLEVLERVEQKEIEPYSDELAAAELIQELPQAGSVVAESHNETVDVYEWKLSNGATVVWKKTDFKNDQVLMAAYSMGGTSRYPDEDYYSASYASTAVSQGGLGMFSPTDLKKFLSGKAVSVSQFVGDLQEGLNGNASPEDIELMFQLIHLHFTDPRKDPGAFESFMTRIKSILPNLRVDPNYFFQDTVARVMSQNHLRGNGIPTLEDLAKVDFERAFEIYKERFANAGDFKFFFVGNIEEEQLRTLVEQYIASLPGSEEKEDYRDLGIRPPDGLVKQTFYKGKDPKSNVRIFFGGDASYNFVDSHKINTLGDVLKNRLIDVIREEKSGVYGVGASGDLGKHPYESFSFNIAFPCGPENTEELISAVFEEIEKLKTEGPSAEELEEVKKAAIQNRKEGLKQNGYWLGKLRFYSTVGADLDVFYEYDKRIENTQASDVQEAARRYLSDGEYIQLVLMPAELQETEQ